MARLTVVLWFVLIVTLVVPIFVQAKATATEENENQDEINEHVVTEIVKTNDDLEELSTKNTTDDDGEIMETANMIVFRPLFAYRQIQNKRQRVYGARRTWNGY